MNELRKMGHAVMIGGNKRSSFGRGQLIRCNRDEGGFVYTCGSDVRGEGAIYTMGSHVVLLDCVR